MMDGHLQLMRQTMPGFDAMFGDAWGLPLDCAFLDFPDFFGPPLFTLLRPDDQHRDQRFLEGPRHRVVPNRRRRVEVGPEPEPEVPPITPSRSRRRAVGRR
jgi:hypothetical protein